MLKRDPLKAKLVDENGSEIDIYSEEGLQLMAELWTKVSVQHKIMYEPTWLGIPVIQYPGDMVMMQELIWKVRPEVIVETGFAHGGTAVLYASLLELLGRGKVISVEIDIRQYNKVAIKSHPLSHRIEMVQGSSVDPETVAAVMLSWHYATPIIRALRERGLRLQIIVPLPDVHVIDA